MFDKFKKVGQQNILVIGDIILDKYIIGATHRMSPEAPVPVVNAEETNFVLGGAANVAANLQSLGANFFLIGQVGKDDHGDIVQQLINDSLSGKAALITSSKITTTKTRIVSKGHQLLRVDEEDTNYLSKNEEIELLATINNTIKDKDITGIILQDYNKGLFSEAVISSIMEIALSRALPIFVDPKNHNFWKYKNATVFKPNLSELLQANNTSQKDYLERILQTTSEQLKCKILFCTLAERGNVFVQDSRVTFVPTQKIDVVDVSGAGDSALAIITLSYLLGYDTKEIAQLANFCGKVACMKTGVSTVSLNEIKKAFTAS